MSGNRILHRAVLVAASMVVVLISSAPPGHASGSYTSRPTRPPSSVDRASYELGKKIFAGEYTPGLRAGSAESQRPELAELQAQLPGSVRSRVDLTTHAGRLDDEQMAALRYFLSKRYKVR